MQRVHRLAKIVGIHCYSTRTPFLLIQHEIMDATHMQTMWNTTELPTFLLSWCAGKQSCYGVLWRYFPPHTKLPTNVMLFSLLLNDIMLSHKQLETEAPLVTKIYSFVSALAIAVNLCLLIFLFSIPYKSTTSVFLTIIVVLDLQEACAILVNLYYLHGEPITYNHPEDIRSRKLNQFQQLFWSISCIFIMLLVAVDRWTVHNTVNGYLFRHFRKTKICCSLGLIVVLVAVINHMLPLTVDIILNGETVQVFICITHSCHGSLLLKQRWRLHEDARIYIYLKCFQCCVGLICLAFAPLYGCTWSALKKKALSEKQYEVERAKLALHGQEIVYFNDIHVPKLRPQSDLPVIYEVDEDNESIVDKGVMFPYTLQIWHKASSLCSMTSENTCLYDELPVPENAYPLTVQNFAARRKYDSNVDRLGFRPYYKKAKLERLAFKSKFPARRSYLDLNLNALTAFAKSTVGTDAVSLPPNAQAAVETCPHCLHKKQVNHQENTFSIRQIIFSINCCCNRGPPIDCHTEITYLNGGDYCETARTSSIPRTGNCTRNMETVEGCRNTISHKQTDSRVTGRSQDLAVLYDTNIVCTIPELRLQMLRQENSNDIELKLNKRHLCYDHHGDWQSTLLPGGTLPSCGFPEHGSVLKPAIKPHNVTHQLHSTPRFMGTNNYPIEEYCNSQLRMQQCGVCKIHVVGDECANASCNNNFLNRIRRAKLLLPGNTAKDKRQDTQYKGNELPVVDFRTAKSQSIMHIVDEYYSKHAHRLKPIGIPSALNLNTTTQKMVQSKCIIRRLIFLTGCYIVAFTIPCVIELTNVPYSTVLYMSSSFKIFMHFISLLIFSRGFRHKLVKCFFRKRLASKKNGLC